MAIYLLKYKDKADGELLSCYHRLSLFLRVQFYVSKRYAFRYPLITIFSMSDSLYKIFPPNW